MSLLLMLNQGGGGSIFNETHAASVALGFTEADTATYVSPWSDSIVLGFAPSPGIIFNDVISESVVPNYSITSTMVMVNGLPESVACADSVATAMYFSNISYSEGITAGFTTSTALSGATSDSVTLGYSVSASGGTIVSVYNEALTFSVAAAVNLAQNNWTIVDSISASVAVADQFLATKTYADAHAAQISAGYSITNVALYPNVLSESVTAGFTLANHQTFVETLVEATSLAFAMGHAQTMFSAISDGVNLQAAFYTFDPDLVYEHVHVYDGAGKIYSQYSRQITLSQYQEIVAESAYYQPDIDSVH